MGDLDQMHESFPSMASGGQTDHSVHTEYTLKDRIDDAITDTNLENMHTATGRSTESIRALYAYGHQDK